MKKEILRIQDICAGTYDSYGLDHFRLHVCEGEFVNIIGMSGSGKTLIYEYFMGHIPLKGGKVIYNNITNKAGSCFSGMMDVVCIGHDSTLIPGLSVAENIFIITGKRKVHGFFSMKNIYYRAKMLLSRYAPDIQPSSPVRDLTPLQMRIVEILRAVENEVKLVYIDDVFQGCGQDDVRRILNLLKQLKQKNIALIYASHQIDFTKAIADKVVVMRRGKNVRTFFEDDYDGQLCQKFLMGNEDIPEFARESACTDQIVFSVKNLTGEKYVKNITMSFRRGEIVGLYDLNNCRNMELLDMIIGNCPVVYGDMILNDKIFVPKNPDHAIYHNIGYIPMGMQEKSLVESMSFMDNLCLPVLKKTSRFKIFRDRHVPDFLGREYMESLGVPFEMKDKPVKHFDSYIQNSILLTRWLLFKPFVMVCMEPWGNADMIMKDIYFKSFQEMAKNGTTVLIASQNMCELRMICDTVYVLNNDKIDVYRQNCDK